MLIAILLGLIIWGIGQLVHGAPPQEPATTIAPTITSKTSKTPTTPRSSAAPVTPPTHHSDEQTTTATTPGTDAPISVHREFGRADHHQYPVTWGVPVAAAAVGDHAAVATGPADRDHIAAGPVKPPRP